MSRNGILTSVAGSFILTNTTTFSDTVTVNMAIFTSNDNTTNYTEVLTFPIVSFTAGQTVTSGTTFTTIQPTNLVLPIETRVAVIFYITGEPDVFLEGNVSGSLNIT